MEALRIVKRPFNGRITIDLPDEFPIQDEVEIIILPYREKKKLKKFDPREFKGASKLNMTIEEIDQECRKLRDEWDRSF